MKRVLILAALAAGLTATPAAARIKDWKITPASQESVLIMRAERQPFDYTLSFSREGRSGFGSRVFQLGVRSYDFAPYTARTLGPGSYQLNSLSQQGAWSSCYANGSFAFTVEPGRVYYLDLVNTQALLVDLQQGAMSRGKAKLTRGALAVGWQPTVQPQVGTPTEAELGIVREFVRTSMPGTTAPVTALAVRPITFGATRGEKFMQVCG